MACVSYCDQGAVPTSPRRANPLLRMKCSLITKDVSISNLGLGHPEPHRFTTCQWKWPPISYVVYRLLAAIFFSVWLVMSGFIGNAREKWFIFLTNWTFLMLTLTTVITAATATLAYLKTRTKDSTQARALEEGASMSCVLKMQWLLFNITMPWCLTVTCVYWILLWSPSHSGQLMIFIKHGSNSIYVLIDLLVSATPVRLSHVLYPMAYSVAYIAFSFAYLGLGGRDVQGNAYVYHVFDLYGRPAVGALLAAGLTLVAAPLAWLAVVLVRRFAARISAPSGGDRERQGDADVQRALTDV